ncbi:type II toxin-antitoxin system PemK/MazF family toxin [Streptomyces sp. NPDC058735]|uniref:type II toxin-antitoxin system PemK/MazF family toxin n=1 Tax=unclassified Streptomyces TaxID=2593676 RepID=UPI00367B02AA
MRRGDIYLVDLEPVRGGEAGKGRPAVIVSNDAANESVARHGRGVVTVAPLTSNTSRVLTFQVLVRSEESRLPKDSKVQCEQVRAVGPDRLLHKVGAVPRPRMAEVDRALRRHLAL